MSDFNIRAFKSKGTPDVYILNTAAIVGEIIFVQVFDDYLTAINKKVSSYTLSIGDAGIASSTSNKILLQAKIAGLYYPILHVYYDNGSTDTFELKQAIRVYEKWPVYDPTKYRVLDEIDVLQLPYSKEDVSIKPNEFGVADVVNAALTKIYRCIEYTTAQTRSFASTTPTEYIGWLGNHVDYSSKGVRWNTASNFPDVSAEYSKASVNSSLKEFDNLIDAKLIGNELYIISKDRVNKNINLMVGNIEREFRPLVFDTIHTSLGSIKNVSSMSVSLINADRRAIYIADNLSNKIFKIIIDISTYTINIEQAVGGYGSRTDPTKFYSVNHVDISNDYIYAVDYNNRCIKVLNDNLGYIRTIYNSDFEENPVISTCISNNIDDGTSLLFALTETKRIYILQEDGSIYNSNVPYYDLEQIDSNDIPKKISLDYGGSFLYVLCNNSIHKYSTAGLYIGKLQLLPNSDFKSITTDVYRNIYVIQSNVIHKMLDVVESFDISRSNFIERYIPLEDILIDETNLSQDWIVNVSLKKLATNIDFLYRSIHSKFGFIKTNTKYGVKLDFTTIPISQVDTAACLRIDDVGVAVNELSISQVYNRDIHKMYECIYNILQQTKAVYASSSEKDGLCKDAFCWSWKSTRCEIYDKPFVRVCDINPVTFAELEGNKKGGYEIDKRWSTAFSSCCTGIPPEQG